MKLGQVRDLGNSLNFKIIKFYFKIGSTVFLVVSMDENDIILIKVAFRVIVQRSSAYGPLIINSQHRHRCRLD